VELSTRNREAGAPGADASFVCTGLTCI
jgi:hypothetical protein